MGTRIAGLLFAAVVVMVGCDRDTSTKAEANVEQLPEIVPDLPEVPVLPPAPFPTTYADESYSVYGMRQRLSQLLDTDLVVSGYIVDIYEPPPCKAKKKDDCPRVDAPHMFIADKPDITDRADQLLVVGYADNQEQLAKARRGRKTTTISGTVVVPRDLAIGSRVTVKGHFTLISSGGFNTSNGLVEYVSHEKSETALAQK